MESRLLSYLQLFRIPNVFTALADVLMGFLLVRGGVEPPFLLALLGAASALLYTGGMVLNDVHDVEQDGRERPGRPIPSGRISLGVARTIGYEMLLFGAGLGWTAAYLTGDSRPGIVVSLLVIAIWLYNAILKPTFAGPVSMGACRFLNVLLGMSASSEGWDRAHWTVAAGIGIYVVGVTWFARREAHEGSRRPLTLAFLVMIAGIGLLFWFPNVSDEFTMPRRWEFLWIAVVVLIGWRMLRAICSPTPHHVQRAVQHAILGLFMLDAGVCMAMNAGPTPIWPMVVLSLSLPTMFLARWVYST